MATAPADFLSGADWAVIVLYLGGIIALGSWCGKNQIIGVGRGGDESIR
jgi:hypothetical protein